MTLEELVQRLTESHKRLEELKAQSPEVAEALEVAEEYHRLYSELQERCKTPPYIPVPYPVYPQPSYPWWYSPWRVMCAGDTTTAVKTAQVISPVSIAGGTY